MKKGLKIFLVLIAVLASWLACKKPYSPKLVGNNTHYMVVEGIINTGNDSTIFKLTKTVAVSARLDSTAVLGAGVIIEGKSGDAHLLSELGNGRYGAGPLGLDSTKLYRVHILTVEGVEYASDYVQSRTTPPIDSVGYNVTGNGIQIYVNTHNSPEQARYYRWDYRETWQFHAKYGSGYVSDGVSILPRTTEQMIFSCFGNHYSNVITLGSSAKLAQNVIYQAPVIAIPSTSEKIETRYSILVKQYALTPEAYSYWQSMKNNTEQIGSIFDPQPSEVSGNIHCLTNPALPVLGYVSAGTIQQKRIFIDQTKLPQTWQTIYPYDCQLDSNLFCRPTAGGGCLPEVQQNLVPLPNSHIPVAAIYKGGFVVGYTASDEKCVDCTLRGTKQVPDFWR